MSAIDFSEITDHPDHDQIIADIISGKDAASIAKWLKIKYKDKEQKHLHVKTEIIQEFINKHSDLESQLKQDIIAVKTGQVQKISAALQNNKTYMERINELADAQVDIKKMITKLITVCEARMEQVFDRIQQDVHSTKGDYVLLKYFEVLFNNIERFDKIINSKPDQIIQVNIQNQVTDSYVAIFQEAIRKTLTHIDAESALLFMEIFQKELAVLKAPKEEKIDSEKEAKILKEVILPQLEKENI